jgi:predicted dehydrogenase
MSGKTLKIGVAGTGFINNVYHMPAFHQIPEAEVVAACGSRREGVEAFASRWGIKKRYSGEDGIEKLCADPDVEAVDVGLPNFLHLRAVRAAAENHKSIICEKPLGRNVKEAEEIVALAARYDVVDCYAENQVFMPQIAKAKEFINSGAVGKPFWVRAREAHFGPHSKWFWNPELAGGGVLMDMGCHTIEVGRYLLGRRPVSVCAWVSTFVHDIKSEENSVVMVNHENSELTQAENSWAAHGGFDLRIEIYGSDGAIYVDATKGTGIQMFTVGAEENAGAIVEKSETKKGWMFPTWDEVVAYGFQSELRHFVTSIVKSEYPRERFEDGLVVNRVIDAGYRSVHSKKWEPV